MTIGRGSLFRTDIQGLRALAVLSVLVFHTFPVLLPGGFVGVDIFFVISGYLITQIIVKELDCGTFSLTGFYQRRVRRIFPALFAMLTVTTAAGAFILSPQAFKDLGRSLVSSVFFFSNFDYFLRGDYFSTASELQPLLHTWSLSVEEQFYLLFPPLMMLLWPKSRFVARLALAGCAIASLALAQWLLARSTSAAFYLSPARAVELLAGALVALGTFPNWKSALARGAASILGLTLIAVSVVFYSADTLFPGLTALAPCLGTALVIHAGRSAESAGGRLVSSRPFVSVGDLSYSLYLWHWPILAMLRHLYGTELPVHVGFLAVASAFGAAAMSYRWIERPFLTAHASNSASLRKGITAMVVYSVAGGVIFLAAGFPARFSPASLAAFAYAGDSDKRRTECHNRSDSYRSYESNCVLGAPVAADIVVWGDSHGAELAAALGEVAAVRGRAVRQISSPACPPSIGFVPRNRPKCAAFNQLTMERILSDAAVRKVVIVVNGEMYDQRRLMEGYEAAVSRLSASKEVILVQQIPLMRNEPPAAVGRAVAWGQDVNHVGLARSTYDDVSAKWNGFLESLGTRYGVKVVSPATTLCGRDFCHAADEAARPLYFNASHLGMTGARVLANSLTKQIF